MRSKRKCLVRIINHIWWNANTAYQHKQLTPMMMILGLFYNHRCWGTLHSLGKPRTPPHTKVFWSWNSIMIPNTAATLHQNFWKIENKRLCNGPEKVPWLKKLDWNAVPEFKWAVHKQMAAKKSGPKFLRSVLRDSQSQTEIRSFRFMLLNVGSTSYWIMGCT